MTARVASLRSATLGGRWGMLPSAVRVGCAGGFVAEHRWHGSDWVRPKRGARQLDQLVLTTVPRGVRELKIESGN